MSEHTPGPWTVGENRTWSENHRGWTVYSDTVLIGEVFPHASEPTPEAKANARLIAACPTMAKYVITKALEGDTDAETIARSFGWTPQGYMGKTEPKHT